MQIPKRKKKSWNHTERQIHDCSAPNNWKLTKSPWGHISRQLLHNSNYCCEGEATPLCIIDKAEDWWKHEGHANQPRWSEKIPVECPGRQATPHLVGEASPSVSGRVHESLSHSDCDWITLLLFYVSAPPHRLSLCLSMPIFQSPHTQPIHPRQRGGKLLV